MNDQPLVTVNILSFNRRDELRNTLTKVFEQDYKNIEVIVVDNASSDGSADMVKTEFPSVQLIQMEKNIGIAGWNEGFKVAKGEYVLVLDDDAYPENGSISSAIKRLISETLCGTLALNVYNTKWQRSETENYDRDNNLTFTGCGAMIPKKVIEEVGMFEPLFFVYFHEVEFSMRVINMGFKIMYEKESKIVHWFSDHNREIRINELDIRKQLYFLRNSIIVLLLHFNFYNILFRLIRIIIGRVLWSVGNGFFILQIKNLVATFLILPKILKQREILSPITQKLYNYGAFLGGFFFDKRYSFIRPKWLK